MPIEQQIYYAPYDRPSGGDNPVDHLKAVISEGSNQLIAELEAGQSERFTQYLAFMGRFHGYSQSNQMLIFMQRPDATLVRGYKQWFKDGFQVKKGEHGIGIFAPLIKKKED